MSSRGYSISACVLGPRGDGPLEPQSGSNLPRITPEVGAGTAAGEGAPGEERCWVPISNVPERRISSESLPRPSCILFVADDAVWLHILLVFQEIKLHRLS